MAERREREPARLAELLRTLVAGRGWEDRLALGRLRAEWREVAGELLASRSEPVRLTRGVLTVRAEGTWATELALLATTLVSRADAHLGGGRVREVKVVAGRPSMPPE